MIGIVWGKTYEITVDDRVFRIILSAHESLGFYAKCLWYEKGRALKAPGQAGVAQYFLEQRYAATEDEAFSAIKSWATSKFGQISELKEV